MGYYVDLEIHCLIPAAKAGEALAAINALFEPRMVAARGTGGAGGGGHPWQPNYAWVQSPPRGGFTSLVDALRAWRYSARVAVSGDVAIEHFNGEKWGDDELLYYALASCLAPGSTIRVRGDDDARWAYQIAPDGRLIEGHASVEWQWDE